METRLLKLSARAIQLAAGLLREGQVVGIPTETVYGLAANALCRNAVAEIFKAKGRPQDNPLIVHVASQEMLKGVAGSFPPRARRLAQAFWPGPLTMILPKGEGVAPNVTAGLDTVAVRMPAHPGALRLIAAAGLPLAAPSANRSGRPSPTTAQHVYHDLMGKIPLILDGGPCKVGVESTVLSLAGEQAVLLRPGIITAAELSRVLGEEVALDAALTRPLASGESPRSPGMKYRHYAPKAKVVLVKGSLAQFAEYVGKNKKTHTFALCFEGEEGEIPLPCVTYGSEGDAASQAAVLFSALRRLDQLGAKQVYARLPAQSTADLAVYNRLLRAAAFHEVGLCENNDTER